MGEIMKITGLAGLHDICKARSGGLSLPDETSVGEDVKIILSIHHETTKAELRALLESIPIQILTTEIKIELQKDLK